MTATIERATATLRAAIYTRVSQDASGAARSPAEQEAEARRDCKRESYSIVDVYTDNDRGASRFSRKGRPELARLLDDIAAGRVDVVVAWESSRLGRGDELSDELLRRCRAHGVLMRYSGRTLDPNDPYQAFTIGLDNLLDELEVGKTRERTMRAMRANVTAGRPHGPCPVGYRRVYDASSGALTGQVPDEALAPIVREIFRRVANGEICNHIAADLNARGISNGRAPTAKRPRTRWTDGTIRTLVASQTYLGHRTHGGVVVAENAWLALVDGALWHAANDQLRARPIVSRNVTPRGARARQLLSGLATCAVCDELIYSSSRRTGDVYRCSGVGHVARKVDRLDAAIETLLAERFAQRDARRIVTGKQRERYTGAKAELKALEAQLKEADDALYRRQISADAFGRLERRLAPDIAKLKEIVKRERPDVSAPVAQLLDADDVAAKWREMPLAAKRRAVADLLVDAKLAPTGHRRAQLLGLGFEWAGILHVDI